MTPRDKKAKQASSVKSQSVSSRSDRSALSDRRVSQSPAPVAKPRRLSTSSAGSGRSPSVSEKSLDKKVGKLKKNTSESPSISSTLSPAVESKVEVDVAKAHAEGGSVTPVVTVESKVEPAELAGGDDQGVPSESPIVEETIDEESVREPLSEAEIKGQNDDPIEPSLRVTAEELIPPGSSRGLSPARSYGATEMEPPTTMSTRPQSSRSFNSGSPEESGPQQDVLSNNESTMSKEPVKTEADNEDQPPEDSSIKNDLEKQTEEETSSLIQNQDTAPLDAMASEDSKVELGEEPVIAKVADRSLPIDAEVTVTQALGERPFIHDTALEDISETKVFVDSLADPHSTALDTPVTTEALLDEENTAASHQESLDVDGGSDQDSLDLDRAPSVDRASLDSHEDHRSDRSSLDIGKASASDKTSTRMEGGDDDVVSVGGDIDSVDGASLRGSDDDGSLGEVSMEITDAFSDDRSSLEMSDIPVAEPSGTKEERRQSIDALLKRTEAIIHDAARDSTKVVGRALPTLETPTTNLSAIAELHASMPPETKALLERAKPDTESIGSLPDAEEIPDDIAKMDDLDGFSEPRSPTAQYEEMDKESAELTTPRDEYPDYESLGSPSWSSHQPFPSDGELDDLGSTPDPSYLSEGDENAAAMDLGVMTPPTEPPVSSAPPPVHQAVAQPMPDLTKEAPAQAAMTSAMKTPPLWDPLQRRRTPTPTQKLQVRSQSAESPSPKVEKEPDVPAMEGEPVSEPRSPPLEHSLFSTRDIVQEQPQNVSNQLPRTKKVQQWDPLMKQTRRVSSESSMQRPGVTVARIDQGKRPSLDFARQNRMPMPRPKAEQKMVESDLFKNKPSTSHHFSPDDPVEDDPPSQSSPDRHQRLSNDNPPNEEEKKPEERNPKRKKGNLIVSCALYVLGGIAVTVFFLRKRGG